MAMAATHEKILVQGPIRFQHISALSFNVQSNQHGHMSIKGYFCPESAQNDSVQELTGRDFCLFAPKDEESNKLHPIFSGTAETSCVGRIGDVYVANMNLIGATSQLDIEPKSRSFQNVDMSYRQVVEDVLSYTPNASADFNAIADQPIKKTLIQYEETDWAFIKRLASMLGVSLMADVTTPFPRFSFGQTDLAQADLSANEYTILMDQRFYNLGSTEAGQYKPDFLCYMVPSLQYYPPGSKVLYDGQSLVVCEVNGTLIDSELLYTYKVGHSGWLGQRELKNQKLIGLSLQGTVTETQREIVRIKLDIDKGRNAGFYPFSWIPESGNLMYCMPKKGTRATLYLPSTDTGEAVVITSPRTNGDDCGEMSDPQMRCFTTEHGKKMCLYPTQMIFSGGAPNETLQIQMDQLNYMLMGSTRPIQIVARLNIDIKAPAVILSTPQEVQTGRSSVHAQAKVGLIIPKGTGGGNPPTGGGDTFFIMQFQFDALGEQGILLGLDPQPHDRFNDEPEALRNWGKLLLNFIIGAVVTVALVGLAVATGGIAGMALAALAVGTAAKTVQMTLVDGYTKSNRSAWGAIDFVLRGSVIDSRETLRSMWADIGNGAKELAHKFTDKYTEVSHGIVDVTGVAAYGLLSWAGLPTDGLDDLGRAVHGLLDVGNGISHGSIDLVAGVTKGAFTLSNGIEDGLIKFAEGVDRGGGRLLNAAGMALQDIATSKSAKDFASNVIGGAVDVAKAASAGAKDIAIGTAGAAKDIAKGIADGAKDIAIGTKDAVLDVTESTFSVLEKAVSPISNEEESSGEDTPALDFTGKLKGEDVTLPGVTVQTVTYTKRDTEELDRLRKEFNYSERANFLKSLGEDPDILLQAGFSETDIKSIQNGTVPPGWQVHHKLPLDDGGTNDPSNLVLIKNDPYHKVITNFQNAFAKTLSPGETKVVEFPIPEGNIYPPKH